MNELRLYQHEPLTHVLACAALNPQLRSLLFPQISSARLVDIAKILAAMLEITTKSTVRRVVLGKSHSEDDLWGSYTLQAIEREQLDPQSYYSQLKIDWQPGLLDNRGTVGAAPQANHICLVIIPDICEISLIAARACIALNNAAVAHLERHGRQEVWCPDICWLVGYSGARANYATTHLLDRFTFQPELTFVDSDQQEHINQLQEFNRRLEAFYQSGAKAEVESPLQPEVADRLRQAVAHEVRFDPERVDDVLARSKQLATGSLRRAIVLLRLARTLAQYELAEDTTHAHIDRAAHMLNIQLESIVPTVKQDKAEEIREVSPHTPLPRMAPAGLGTQPQRQGHQQPQRQPPFDSIPKPVQPSKLPYGQTSEMSSEDRSAWQPVLLHQAGLSLQLPRFVRMSGGGGEPIGIEQVSITDKLAIVPTLLEAVRMTPLRYAYRRERGYSEQRRRVIVMPTDLRGYRRARVRQLHLIIIDYTCLPPGADWATILQYELERIDQDRADIALIQVGVGDDGKELHAREIVLRNPTIGQIQARLQAQPGKATPLAHGLDLARQRLERELRNRRGAVRAAHVLVATDGRGNVPLDASENQPPVGRKGIDDAQAVARSIAAFVQLSARVTTVVLDPQPQAYRDLPRQLARELGSEVKMIPSSKPHVEGGGDL